MEIPGNEIRIKSKTIQGRIKVNNKSTKAGATGGSSGTKGTQGSEHIALSSQAKDIQKAHEVVKNTADIRVDKVERIKAEIAEGRFHVNSHELAEKILKDGITESKFLG